MGLSTALSVSSTLSRGCNLWKLFPRWKLRKRHLRRQWLANQIGLFIALPLAKPALTKHLSYGSHLKSAHLTATSRCIFSCLKYRRSASNFSSVVLILSIKTSCSYCSLKKRGREKLGQCSRRFLVLLTKTKLKKKNASWVLANRNGQLNRDWFFRYWILNPYVMEF